MSSPASSNSTFKYSNKTYTIVGTLFTSTGNKDTDVNISLDPEDIEEIVYEGRLNDLLLRGHIVYTDKYALVDKMLNQHFGYFQLLFALNKDKTDDQVGIGEIDNQNKFVHNFIATNIKVIARSASVVKYQIDLVSMNWFKCISNVQYSNYDKGPQPIFDIVKSCFASKELKVDDDTFNKVSVPIRIGYITQLNDNMFTVMKYLMHKLYYFSDKDDSVKFFLYDWFNDKYRILDLKNKDTALGTYSTVLSFFKTSTETMIQQEPTNIGSLKSAVPKTYAYQNAFDNSMFQYDFNGGEFKEQITPTDQTINYFNNKIDNDNYDLKYQKMFDVPNQRYASYGALWNNTYDAYNKTVQMLEESNAFILNITGDIRRQAGSYTVITLDRSIKNLTTDRPSDLEKLKQKYKAFEGVWLASKVRNIICPSKQTFRQQLVLFRNFIPKYIATTS